MIQVNDTSAFIENQNIKNLILFKIVSALVLGLGCTTIAFSRLVLGAHSINQVVWGLILGSTTGYVWTTQVRPVILRDLEEMRVQVKSAHDIRFNLRLYWVLPVAFTLLSMVIYWVNSSIFVMPESWIERIINCKR